MLNLKAYGSMCSTPKPKHTRIGKNSMKMIDLRLIQMVGRTLNDGLENHFFYMQHNANGVDEMHLNKHAMVSEKEIK